MKSKKIVLALSLVLALGATMVVGGSLAWFTDTDEATNTFTVGSVEIVQNEIFDETTAELIPVVKDPDLTDPTTMTKNNNYIQKRVTVENTGKNPAYVQTFVAVPAALDNCGALRIHDNPTGVTGNGWVAVDGDTSTADIDPVAVSVILDDDNADQTPAVEYNVYKYRNENPVPAPAVGVVSQTDAVVLGVYIDKTADIEITRDSNNNITEAYFVMNGVKSTYNVAKMTLNVYVASQAVQSQGFEADTVNNKTAAQVALDSAFLDHPWA